MSAIDDAKAQIEAELRTAVGQAVPDAAEQQWIADLAGDFAEQKVQLVAATTDDQKQHIADNLDVLNARWKLRLAQKELLASQTVEKLIGTVFSTAVTCFFPALGAFGGIAKLIVSQVASRTDAAGTS